MRLILLPIALAIPVSAVGQDSGVGDTKSVSENQLDVDSNVDDLVHVMSDEEIVVTAGGSIRPPPSDLVHPSTLIRHIDQGAGARLENILREQAGIAQFRRSDGRTAHPTSQGITVRGLGGNASSRALILLDGVPQADPFGGWVAWTAFDSLRLAGVRITRGGGSGADGAGALAATIDLSSDMDWASFASAAVGSRSSTDLMLAVRNELGNSDIALDGRWSRGDGFIPIAAGQRGSVDRAAPYDQSGAGVRARIDAGHDRRIEVSLRGWRDRRDRGTDYSASRIDGLDASVRYILDPETLGGLRFSLLAYAQLREFNTSFASVSPDRDSVAPALLQRVPSNGYGTRLEIRPPIAGADPVRFGFDWRRVEGETQEKFFFTGISPGRFRVAGGASETVGAFIDGWLPLGKLQFTLAARLDHWRLGEGYRRERNIGGTLRSVEQFETRSGSEGTGRIGIKVDGAVEIRAAAYTGWRLPTLNELYRPFRVGPDATAANELLRPERLWGGELGLQKSGSLGSIEITAYWNRLNHAIANVTLARGPGVFPGVGFVAAGGTYAQRQNLDAIVAKGVEVQSRLPLGPILLGASYAFTDARVQASGTALALDGLKPAQVAKNSGSVSASFDILPLRLEARLRYIGSQNDDDLGFQRLDDAVTVDAFAEWGIGDNITATLRAENLFDALVPAAFGAGGALERASPRSVWVGVSARF
jgi:vitamin B12 transporter